MTISNSIELYDNFSGVFTSMSSAMNLMLSGIDNVQSAMGAGVDTSSFDASRESMREAEAAVLSFQEQIEKLKEESSTVPPIKMPVEWEGNLEPPVFTTTGIERYEQELSNTNTLMNDLIQTQANINSNAADVLSPSAMYDLNNINSRMETIQQRIRQIENNPLNMGTDMANAGLESLRHQLAQAQQAQRQLNTAVNNMDVGAANVAYARLSSTIGNTERYIRDNVNEQGLFNEKISQGTNNANELMGKIKAAVGAYLSLRGVGEALDISDEITQTKSRLDLMLNSFEDTSQTADDLFKKIYISAQDARGSLSDMASVVARFGNNAKDAFSSTDEVVAFANLVQKQMTIAGASTAEASNAMIQLSQGLGSGVLRGDELNSIFEQAPNLIQNIADYLDVPIGKIREMAKDGELTADIVKNAIFAATDDINNKFDSMPMTWGQLWTQFKNEATMAFEPVLGKLNELANSEAFQSFTNRAVVALAMASTLVINIFSLIAKFAGFVANNWSWLQYIIYGVVAALIVYNATMGIAWLTTLKNAAALAWKTICDWAETAAIFAMMVAQEGLNAALAACPITWIIILIIALIAIIFAVCAAIAHFTGVAESAFGVICGAVAVAGAFIWNLIVGLINAIIQFVWTHFVEPFIGIIEFILNVCNGGFNSFGDAVANLIGQIISWFLSLGKVVTKIIDAIFGTDWTGGLNSLQDSVLAWGKNENAITLSREAPEVLQRVEYGTAWNAGVEFGDNVSASVSGFFDDIFNPATNMGEDALNGQSFGDGTDALKDPTDATAKNTKKIADNTKKSDDILSMIKDSISRERIANYTTKQVNVDMSGMSNQIASSLSIVDVVKAMENEIARSAAAAVEGV